MLTTLLAETKGKDTSTQLWVDDEAQHWIVVLQSVDGKPIAHPDLAKRVFKCETIPVETAQQLFELPHWTKHVDKVSAFPPQPDPEPAK